jgi:23S rRNA-/tRNA-specific pseudouridylate synthase
MREPERRWTVPAGNRGPLTRVIANADWSEAVRDGRLFVNGQRVEGGEPCVGAGDVIELYAARAPHGSLRLLADQRGWFAVEKPPALPTEPDRPGTASALSELARMTGLPRERFHAVSRLDVGVSGIVLFATTEASRKEAARLRSEGRLRRGYVGIGAGRCAAEGRWSDSVGGRSAVTRFRTCGVLELGPERDELRLLALAPETGRTHQLRQHAARAGAPLVGDRRYGGPATLLEPSGRVLRAECILLHCARVELGGTDAPWSLTSALPAAFHDTWTTLGGSDIALEATSNAALWSSLWEER